MRHRENFNELIGHLERDAVHLSLPNRMALLALNNKVFANGMEAHLDAQQAAQAPQQPVYIPPPSTAPTMPTGTAATSAAPADGPPSWMSTAGGLGIGAAKLGGGLGIGAAKMGGGLLGGVLGGLSTAGAAGGKMMIQYAQAQQAAQTAIQDDDDPADWMSVAGGSEHMDLEDAHALQMQIYAQHVADAEEARRRAAQAQFEETHQKNPFADDGQTHALMSADTSSAQAITQFALESQRLTHSHDGSDLLNTSSPSTQWLNPSAPPPTTALVPQSTTLEPQSQELGGGNSVPRGRSRPATERKAKRRRDPTTDNTDYKDMNDVPGDTPEEKMAYMKAQQKAGRGQLRRHTPFAGNSWWYKQFVQ